MKVSQMKVDRFNYYASQPVFRNRRYVFQYIHVV